MSAASGQLILVGLVVFLANAGLLILQLVAGPLLSPFIGSSLETWTSIIASFLIGIALGNAWGGKIADRSPNVRNLAMFLILGAIAALWMIAWPMILRGGLYQSLPLKVRIPILAGTLCVPVAFALSLLTPMAIRIGVPNVASTGRVAGLIFALSTLGCLIGNYLTGFVLIPEFPINTIVLGVVGLLILTAVGVFALGMFLAQPGETVSVATSETLVNAPGMSMPVGFAIVFLCSFAGMTLELSASRLIALILGSSIYTWTGVIGVMLFGTACGNFLGGRLADRAGRSAFYAARENALGWTLLVAGFFGVLVIVIFSIVAQAQAFSTWGLREQILAMSFTLFFAPMFCLGMVSPQVIRLCVSDVRSAGRVAGRIYAVSTVGAIAGTFTTGYAMIATLGIFNSILFAGLIPAVSLLLIRVRSTDDTKPGSNRLIAEVGVMLYGVSTVLGAALGGFILSGQLNRSGDTETVAETNYYTIRIQTPEEKLVIPPTDALGAIVGGPGIDTQHQKIRTRISNVRTLYLDHLTHSKVDLDDPTYFFYRHETIQAEVLWMLCQVHPKEQNVLVIGGGGYTFPRYVRTAIPTANVDVVEIDPGVTKVAFKYLGLLPEWGVNTINMDGRQFVAEKSAKGFYDLVTLDAVNDLSVPSHLLTKECNDAVKQTLKSDGVYLTTVIDFAGEGLLWKAAFRTLKQSFAHVEVMFPKSDLDNQRDTMMDYLKNYDELDGQKRISLEQFLVRLRNTLSGSLPSESEPGNRTALIERIKTLTAEQIFGSLDRSVLVIYAADQPLDRAKLRRAVANQIDVASDTYVVPEKLVNEMLAKGKQIILTDQHAPTDDLMRQVFRKR